MAKKYEDFDKPGIQQEWSSLFYNASPEDGYGVSGEVWTAANEAAAKAFWDNFKKYKENGIKLNFAVTYAYDEALRHRKQYLRANA